MNLPPQIITLTRLFRRELAAIRERLNQIQGTIKQHIEAVEKERHRQSESEHIPTKVTAEVHLPYSVEAMRTADQKSQHTTQKMIAVAAWGAFVAALAYAVMARMQLNEIREQTAQLYRQAGVENAGASHRAVEVDRQLKIAQQQAEAALGQARAAAKNAKAAENNVVAVREGIEESSKRSKEALDATINNFHQEQRAWVGLDVGPDPDHPIRVSELTPFPLKVIASYRIKNFGHGPAFKITSTLWVTTDEIDLEWQTKNQCQMIMIQTEGVIPQQGPEFPAMGEMLFPGGTIDKALGGVPGAPFVGSRQPGRRLPFVFFIGCITYRDQFNISHWTRFCFYTSPYATTKIDQNTPLIPDPMYNDTDDNQQKAKK